MSLGPRRVAAPTTMQLWASCATVDAIAPRASPKPDTQPTPTRPVAWWRSSTAMRATSTARIGDVEHEVLA